MLENLFHVGTKIKAPRKFTSLVIPATGGRLTTNGTLVTDGVSDIFHYGGYGGSGGNPESQLKKFNVDTKTWTSLGTYLYNSFMAGAHHNGILYFCGGTSSFYLSKSNLWSRFDTYDINAKKWTAKASPGTLASSSLTPLNNKLYLFGGKNTNLSDLNILRVYDISTNTWSTLASAPIASSDHSVVVYDGKLYYFLAGNKRTVMEYDPESNTWTVFPEVVQVNNDVALFEDCVYHALSMTDHLKEYTLETRMVRDSPVSPTPTPYGSFRYHLLRVGNKLFSTGGAQVVQYTPI